MHDDVARRQHPAPLVVEIEPVPADVARDRYETTLDLIGEGLAPLAAQAVETVVANDLAHRALGR